MTDPVYTLPELRYPFDALEPHYSAELLELHYTKHHAAYVKQANDTITRLVSAREGAADPLVSRALSKALAFNVSGHLLHSVLWESMSPNGGGEPTGELALAIAESFGNLATLRAELESAVTALQGSGWAALSWEPLAERLMVEQIYDHQSNMTPAQLPILVIDGWEHAYYLQYRNDKAAWLAAFWNVADWERAGVRFESARKASLDLVATRG